MANKLTIGTLGLTHKMQLEVVDEVYEEAKAIRQASYDTVLEIMSGPLTPEEEQQMIANLQGADMLKLMSEKPGVAKDVLQRTRQFMTLQQTL